MSSNQLDLLYGIHSVRILLEQKPERVLEIFCMDSREDNRIQAILKLAKEHGIAIQKVSKKQFDQWFLDNNHQGIAARFRPSALLDENDLMSLLENLKTPPLLLILDGVQDPHNLGACLRTADAVGVTAVIIPKDRAASVTGTVRKVSSGASESVSIVEVRNLARTLEHLKKQGVWIMGASGEGKQSLYQTDLKGPVAIVLGAEGVGLRRLTEEHCDVLMHIPMWGMVESLNVSVAAGVCLYEALRQRL